MILKPVSIPDDILMLNVWDLLLGVVVIAFRIIRRRNP